MRENKKLILIILAIVVSVGLLLIFGVQGVQDRAFALEEQVNTAKSDIKVQEKRRVDLVYNLADCVKEYSDYEAKTLKNIVKERSNKKAISASQAIAAVVEAYPELKSDKQYKELMDELSITENLIANYRSNYNKAVKDYNRYVRKFFNRTCLNILGYENKEYEYLDYEASVDAPQNLFNRK